NVVILNTFENVAPSFSHGLSFDSGKVIVQKDGLFARLHDCFSADPSIYANKCQFTLENLARCGPQIVSRIENIMQGRDSAIQLKDEVTGNVVQITEFDREFLFVFALSNLARYRVVEWAQILEGQTSD